jgi:hypothetical protein
MRVRTREGFSVPTLKRAVGGLGDKGVRANSPIRFCSAGTKLATDCRPGGLGKIKALSFHGLPLTQTEGLRLGGGNQTVTIGGVKRCRQLLSMSGPACGWHGRNAIALDIDGYPWGGNGYKAIEAAAEQSKRGTREGFGSPCRSRRRSALADAFRNGCGSSQEKSEGFLLTRMAF